MNDNMVDGGRTLTCSAGKALAEIFDRKTMPAAELFRQAEFLALRLRGCDEYSMCLRLEFYEAGQRERGAHYFQYNDQSALGRFDGENYQIGLVDVCSQEYPEMAQAMRRCHVGMYDVAMGRKPPYDACPEEVAPIHY